MLRTMRALSREVIRGATGAVIPAILLISTVAAIVLFYDLVTGGDATAQFGRILVFLGLFLMVMFSFRNLRSPEKMEVLSRHLERRDRSTKAVHVLGAFNPVWMSAGERAPPDRRSGPLMPFLVGVIVLIVGALFM